VTRLAGRRSADGTSADRRRRVALRTGDLAEVTLSVLRDADAAPHRWTP